MRQHLSGGERILRVRAGKAGIGHPKHFGTRGKGAIARTGGHDGAREIRSEREREGLRYCATPGAYPGVPGPDACRMNAHENLARCGGRARHILEEDDLRTSERVDAIGFHFPGPQINDIASVTSRPWQASRATHPSEPTWAPFSATERFINRTANAMANVSAAAIQKVSK